MCNDYRLLTASATLFDGFSEIKIPIRFSEGNPNLEAREDIKITDTAPIMRAVEGELGAGEPKARASACGGEYQARIGSERRGAPGTTFTPRYRRRAEPRPLRGL
jgi:putative SOS response-associated peptidase YedK